MTSPCIKVCQMDPARGVCIGCCRTLDEIARWGGMSDAEREQVLSLLAVRRMELFKVADCDLKDGMANQSSTTQASTR